MTRQEYTDKLEAVLFDCFPDEQGQAELSADDIAAVMDELAKCSNTVLGELQAYV